MSTIIVICPITGKFAINSYQNFNCRCEICKKEYSSYNKNQYIKNTKIIKKEDYKNNPKKYYFKKLKTLYNVTEEDYKKLLKKQKGKCAICEVTTFKQNKSTLNYLGIDHDHSCCPEDKSCGKCIRGLLCLACNIGLGNFKDSKELLKRALNYLGNI